MARSESGTGDDFESWRKAIDVFSSSFSLPVLSLDCRDAEELIGSESSTAILNGMNSEDSSGTSGASRDIGGSEFPSVTSMRDDIEMLKKEVKILKSKNEELTKKIGATANIIGSIMTQEPSSSVERYQRAVLQGHSTPSTLGTPSLLDKPPPMGRLPPPMRIRGGFEPAGRLKLAPLPPQNSVTGPLSVPVPGPGPGPPSVPGPGPGQPLESVSSPDQSPKPVIPPSVPSPANVPGQSPEPISSPSIPSPTVQPSKPIGPPVQPSKPIGPPVQPSKPIGPPVQPPKPVGPPVQPSKPVGPPVQPSIPGQPPKSTSPPQIPSLIPSPPPSRVSPLVQNPIPGSIPFRTPPPVPRPAVVISNALPVT